MASYQIQKIGLLPGGTFSIANDINNLGEVAGSADAPFEFNGQQFKEQAVFFSSSTGLQSINTPSPTENSFGLGLGINDLSQVVGYIVQVGNQLGPYIWSAMTGVKILDFRGDCTAGAINQTEEIVGSQQPLNYPEVACVWDGPQQTFRFLEPWTGPDLSEATDVNDNGVIVGWKEPAGGVAAAFIVYPGGAPQPIGPFEDPVSYAYGIGNAGHVVGATENNGVSRAFVWTQATGTAYLDTPDGTSSSANGVNSTGSIVGTMTLPDGTARAFLYENGIMTDLNTILPVGKHWQLQNAVAINDHGQIAGNGLYHGVKMGFVLGPPTFYTVRPIVLEYITHIIRHDRELPWPFGWPFPDPDPGPAPWLAVFPEGKEPMILAAMTSLVSQLSDEKLRKHLKYLIMPLLEKALKRLENEK